MYNMSGTVIVSSSWLHYLNYTGICLISDVPTAEENTMKVCNYLKYST